MKRKRIFLITMILLFSLLCVALFFFYGRPIKEKPKESISFDINADEWTGDQQLPNGVESDTKTIKIPGISTLVFKADCKEQKVNFYNPEDNDGILFQMTLFVNGKAYWQSKHVKPGKGYYDITLDNVLDIGEYDAYLLIDCCKEDGSKCNGAKVEFILKVVENL